MVNCLSKSYLFASNGGLTILGFVVVIVGSMLVALLWQILWLGLVKSRFMLPQAWLRQLYLRSALRGYPLYDPPHKVEERLLSREKAQENFDYFMRVRLDRLAYFRDWLRRYFGVPLTLDEAGMRALNRWGNKYAGLLLLTDADGNRTSSYFTYAPPWTGNNSGCNVVFDMGIALGEAIIANCPKLQWDYDPISAILPREARLLKRSPGMSFQRPMLTGFDNPAARKSPLHDVFIFAAEMHFYMRTFKGIVRYFGSQGMLRHFTRDVLLNDFNAALQDYPSGRPLQALGAVWDCRLPRIT